MIPAASANAARARPARRLASAQARAVLLLGLPLALLGGTAPSASQEGYRHEQGATVVEPEHWLGWVYQNDRVRALSAPLGQTRLFEIDDAGIKPVFFRRRFNAALDAAAFAYENAAGAAGDSVRGGATAKSNAGLASRAIDGDLETYWGPAAPATYAARLDAPRDFSLEGLRDWELEVDLGRMVFVDSVEIVFAAGANGDPAKAFVLSASMGRVSGAGPRFVQAGRARGAELGPLESAPGFRRAVFRLEPLDTADWDGDGRPDISGTPAQYFRLRITDSDLWRKELLGHGEEARAAYRALPPFLRGARVFHRWTAGGFLAELRDRDGASAALQYAELDGPKRGPVAYYRREAPRLAEFRVWARGDNYAYRPERRAGGSFEAGGLGLPSKATDGLYQTGWTANTWSPLSPRGVAWWDLGATFWVDDVYLLSQRTQLGLSFAGYELLVSDGTAVRSVDLEQRSDLPRLERALRWDNIVSPEHFNNFDAQVYLFNEKIPLRPVRFVQLRHLDLFRVLQASDPLGVGQRTNLPRLVVAVLAEMQLYGRGYPAEVQLYSPPVAVGGPADGPARALERVSWRAEAVIAEPDTADGTLNERVGDLAAHPEVSVRLQTRTADRIDTGFTYFERFTVAGGDRFEITRQRYEDLLLAWRVWEAWESLPAAHASGVDDDGDGEADEDPIDFVDNDGDGLLDEDGRRLRANSKRPRSVAERQARLDLIAWGPWSEPYAFSGAPLAAPGPRRFLQARVRIASRDPFKTARIRSLRFGHSAPAAAALFGETAWVRGPAPADPLEAAADVYAPPQGAQPGGERLFSYFVRAGGAETGAGFDRILLRAPHRMALHRVRVGRVRLRGPAGAAAPEASRFDAAFAPGEDGRWRDGRGRLMEADPAAADSILVRLPLVVNRDLPAGFHALVELRFAARVFADGSTVSAFVRGDGAFQRVETGDATELVAGGQTRLGLAAGGGILGPVESAGVLTPNGDGTNDRLRLQVHLLKLLDGRPLHVRFYDLGGRPAGRARPAAGIARPRAGRSEWVWDGRGPDGRLVAPGLYICRVEVEADSGGEARAFPVSVAY